MLTSARASRLARMPRRETQQQKMYNAETFLFGTSVGITKAEVEAYVAKISNYEWFRRRWGTQRFYVETQRGVGGHGGHGQVAVGLNVTGVMGYQKGAQRNVVLHEMAHTLAQGKDPSGDWHGPHFARTMLELVRYAVGPAEAKQLRENFKKYRVKVASPTKLRETRLTPAPREIVTPKLWRFEYVQAAQVKTTSIEAKTMPQALSRFADAQQLGSAKGEITNLKVWRGVRQATPVKKAARKRPKAAAPPTGS